MKSSIPAGALSSLLFIFAFLGLGPQAASATIITSPAGTQYSSTVKAELKEGSWNLGSSLLGNINCDKSILEGKVESQGAGVTAGGKLSKLSFTECNGATVTVLKSGSFEIHGTGSGNGTFTSSGAEITVESLGYHCIFTTSNTPLGVVKGGTPATWEIEYDSIPRTGGKSGFLCGSTAQIAATYKFTTPGTLLVD